MRHNLSFCVLMLVLLAVPTFGQETAEEWLYEGIALGEQGRYDEAILAFDEAIRIDPENAEAWSAKGITLMSQGKNDEAIDAFDEAIRLDPENAIIWYGKGTVLTVQGNCDEAIHALDKAIELDPESAEVWFSKGIALFFQDKYDEAIHALDKTMSLRPDLKIFVMSWLFKWYIVLEKSQLPLSIVALSFFIAVLFIGWWLNRLRGKYEDERMILKVKAGIVILIALAIWVYYLSRVLEDDWTRASIALFIAFFLGKSGSDMWKRTKVPSSADEKAELKTAQDGDGDGVEK